MEALRCRETTRSRGSGQLLVALGGVILIIGTMAIAAPLAVLLAMTVGFGSLGALGLWVAGIALSPAHSAVVTVVLGAALLAFGAWLARDRVDADGAEQP